MPLEWQHAITPPSIPHFFYPGHESTLASLPSGTPAFSPPSRLASSSEAQPRSCIFGLMGHPGTVSLCFTVFLILCCATQFVESKEHYAVEAYNWLRQALDDCIVFPGDWALTQNLWLLVDDEFFYLKDGKPKHKHTACNYTITVCSEEPRDGNCRPNVNQLDLPIWGRYNTLGLGAGVPALVDPPSFGVSPAAWRTLFPDRPIQEARRIWVVGKPTEGTSSGAP